jgi:hypothetical protein
MAFGCLPAAALLLGHRGRRTRHGQAVAWLRVGSSLRVAATVCVMLVALWQGAPWSRLAPLGVAERGLVLTEFATLLAFGLWAASPTTASPTTASRTGGTRASDEESSTRAATKVRPR